MDKAKRTAIIAGNWKMNKTPKEATALLNAIAPLVADADCEVIACVPYVDLAAAIEATSGTQRPRRTSTNTPHAMSGSSTSASSHWGLHICEIVQVEQVKHRPSATADGRDKSKRRLRYHAIATFMQPSFKDVATYTNSAMLSLPNNGSSRFAGLAR